jgi:hypothetical protein
MSSPAIPLNANNATNTVYTGAAPCEGSKTMPILVAFSLGNNYSLDLTSIINQGFISNVQTVYVDNSANPEPVSFTMGVTNQVVTFPAYCQGYMPVLQPNPPVLLIACAGSASVRIQLLNYFMPPIMYNTLTQDWTFTNTGQLEVSDTALDALITNGTLPVTTEPYVASDTDHSTTIITGGTPQIAIGANASRKGFTLANPDTATETLYYMYGSGTAGKIPLGPGQTYESGPIVSGQSIYVVAATTAHAYTAYEAN